MLVQRSTLPYRSREQRGTGRSRSRLSKGWPPFGAIAPAFIVRIVQAQIFFVQLRYQRIEGRQNIGCKRPALREFPGGRRQSENPG